MNEMRPSRGTAGSSRSASTQMLTAVKCAGNTSFHERTPGRFTIGSMETTIGSRRTPERPTASATSNRLAPAPSIETRITCAGPAQTRTVATSVQVMVKPKSCEIAPIPT